MAMIIIGKGWFADYPGQEAKQWICRQSVELSEIESDLVAQSFYLSTLGKDGKGPTLTVGAGGGSGAYLDQIGKDLPAYRHFTVVTAGTARGHEPHQVSGRKITGG